MQLLAFHMLLSHYVLVLNDDDVRVHLLFPSSNSNVVNLNTELQPRQTERTATDNLIIKKKHVISVLTCILQILESSSSDSLLPSNSMIPLILSQY